MNIPTDHLGERLQDFADGRLSGTDLAQAREHLEGCARCRRELAAVQHVRQMLAPRGGHGELPPELSAALSGLLDQEHRSAALAQRPRTVRNRGAWRLALAAGVAAIFATTLMLWRNEKPIESDPWTAAVAQHFAAYRGAHLPLAMRSTDPAQLEHFFSEHLDFHTRVYDLDTMGYQVQGGEVVRVNGRSSALSAYRGPGDSRLLCEMFTGRIDELPPAPRTANHNGVAFRVYRSGALTAVYWAEGDLICVLVSDIGSEALLALAFAKAGPAV
ncbi:MAG TPA: zf-HC2 domain-containing protein [Rudaea sp.]|jgi:anti-sigma factor RsiW|nr:zf-HC2 domain-containing protein [Rudaea sp.]